MVGNTRPVFAREPKQSCDCHECEAKTVRFFERKIIDFYRKAGRESLPWRRENITAYEVWVSEIMLQQTQVSRVTEYYIKFLKKFPKVSDLAASSWEEFLPYYAGLGYYRRGRNMLLTAQKVMDECGGEFPRDKKVLMMLPGVGDYTACAILSFAYGENHVAWDTNLKRVIGRFFYGSKNFDSSVFARERSDRGNPRLKERDCHGLKPSQRHMHCYSRNDSIVFKTHAKELNAALMDFGSAICLGRPKCKTCPLASQCVYFSEGGMREERAVIESKVQQSQTYMYRSGLLRFPRKDEENYARRDKEKINWKEAQVFLWLHKDHVLYYSSHLKRFEVFVLPVTYNSRSGIKAYFKEKYDLDLAVRPPHAKTILEGKPTLFVNAQILLGEPRFATFSKDAVKRYNDGMGN